MADRAVNILLALVGLLSIVGLGWLWTSGGAGLNRPQRVGFAYGVGAVWIGVMMGVIPLVGLPLVPAVGWSLVGAPPVGWWVWRRLRGDVGAKDADQPIAAGRSGHAAAIHDGWWWGAAGVVGLLAAIVVARTVVKPIQAWDAWSTYATKAKAMYLSATVPRSMFETVVAPNYPLGVPLQEVWMSWFVGAWDDVAVKLLFPGYLVALLCLVYGELRERWEARVAMGGTLFVAGLPFLLQHGQDGYTDLPLAYFVVGGAVALTRFLRRREGHALALGAILAAGMVWCREDGVLLVVINGALLLYDGARSFGIRSGRTWSAFFRYMALPAAVWGGWTLVKALWAIPANLSLSVAGMAAHLDRLGGAVNALLTALFLEGNWLILWALVFLALAYGERELRREESVFLIWPVLGYLGVMTLLSGVTDLYQFLEVRTVLNRLVLHVAPLAALWVAITYGRWWGLERLVPERGDAALTGGTNV